MALLRDYHAGIGEIIIKYSGTLERYAGDGVMVVFNDPVLGRVDKLNPDSDAGKQHEGGEALDQLVVAGGDTA